jgi:hypothetical protein
VKTRPPGSEITETARDILEREGHNKKTDETITETSLRVRKKLNRALELNLPDSPDRVTSAMASAAYVIDELQDSEARRTRMRQDIVRAYKEQVPILEICSDWVITHRHFYKILAQMKITPDRRR